MPYRDKPTPTPDLKEWNRVRDDVRGLLAKLTAEQRMAFLGEAFGVGYCLHCGDPIRQSRCYCTADD